MKVPSNIILSRTDGVGDMVLTLPMAGVLKQHFPEIKIAVLGKPYTKALTDACIYVDEFIDEKDFFSGNISVCGEVPEAIIHVRTNKAVAKRAKKLKIPLRIGTSSRLYHFTACNKLVKLHRKSSKLHEAQLNIKLLEPLGITNNYSTEQLQNLYGFERFEPLDKTFAALLSPDKFNLIIHPKSQGSSREWPVSRFISLIDMLPEDRFTIFLSGVEKEKAYLQEIESAVKRSVINIGGKMSLEQFMIFLKSSDGIVANATGPLHLGAALGISAYGLFPPLKPIHPGRWAPLGPKAQVFVLDKACSDCRNNKDLCSCINAIEPAWLKAAIEADADKKAAAAVH